MDCGNKFDCQGFGFVSDMVKCLYTNSLFGYNEEDKCPT